MCGGSYNSTDDLYAQVFDPNKAKNVNLKGLNLMFGVNETRFLVQHEFCGCKFT